jgi:anti-sigma B factor antagonist
MNDPLLRVALLRSAALVVVTLEGELDVHAAPAADAAMTTAAGSAPGVVLDLRGLEFIDSSGLKLVLVWHRRLAERGIAFTLVRGAPHVQRPFSSAGLDGLLPWADEPPA